MPGTFDEVGVGPIEMTVGSVVALIAPAGTGLPSGKVTEP